jgi:hypothetical protein
LIGVPANIARPDLPDPSGARVTEEQTVDEWTEQIAIAARKEAALNEIDDGAELQIRLVVVHRAIAPGLERKDRIGVVPEEKEIRDRRETRASMPLC